MYTRVIPSLGALGFFFYAISAYASEVQCNQFATQIAEEYKTTFVSVEEDSKDADGTTQASIGAGVFLDSSGLLLSVGHLAYKGDDQKRDLNLDEETYRTVDELDMFWDGSNQTIYTYWVQIENHAYSMELVSTFRYGDFALFKVDLVNFKGKIVPAKLGDSDTLKQGDPVFMIGNPDGIEYSITAGIVSGLHRRDTTPEIWFLEDFIQTDALIEGGDSGGALLNACGEVVGINDASIGKFGLATPINLIKEFLPQMRQGGNIKCGWFGAEVLRANFVHKDTFSGDLTMIHTLSGYEKKDQLLKLLALTERQSALIIDITDGSPAKKAGLRQGDIITEFNGTKIEGGYGFRLALTKTKVGEEVMVQVTRVDKHGKERPIVCKIKLGDRKTALRK